jgi:hypothetical protein
MFDIINAHNPYDLPVLSEGIKIHYVIFSISTNFCVPYVTFYLKNQGNILSFPYSVDEHYISQTICDNHDRVIDLMGHYRRYVTNIEPMGYTYETGIDGGKVNNIIYAFYKASISNTEADFITSAQHIWPATCWEIFKLGSVYNLVVDVNVTIFLKMHIILHPAISDDPLGDEYCNEGERLPYPMVGYSLQERKKLQFTATFGASRDPMGPLGDFYYYYKKFTKVYADQAYKPLLKLGIVRYVIYDKQVTKDIPQIMYNSDMIGTTEDYIVSNKSTGAAPISYHMI